MCLRSPYNSSSSRLSLSSSPKLLSRAENPCSNFSFLFRPVTAPPAAPPLKGSGLYRLVVIRLPFFLILLGVTHQLLSWSVFVLVPNLLVNCAYQLLNQVNSDWKSNFFHRLIVITVRLLCLLNLHAYCLLPILCAGLIMYWSVLRSMMNCLHCVIISYLALVNVARPPTTETKKDARKEMPSIRKQPNIKIVRR